MSLLKAAGIQLVNKHFFPGDTVRRRRFLPHIDHIYIYIIFPALPTLYRVTL